MPYRDPAMRRECQRRSRARRREQVSVYNKAWRVANPEKVSATQRRYRTKNAIKFLWFKARSRARQQAIEFTITIDDLVMPPRCPWLGIKIVVGGPKDNAPSIDRIDSARGYIPENVEIISWRANRLKNNATIAELAAMGKCAARKLKGAAQ